MLLNAIYRHHTFSWNFIFFNVVALLFVKLAFSQSAFQLATLLDATPAFDSREIVAATNAARQQRQLSTLIPNHKLDLAAREKLEDMASAEYFAHTSPAGVTPWHWFKEAHYTYAYAGENLAIGFVKADDTVDAWLTSPSHRANMLSANYQEIGVAVAVVEMDGTESILVVQLFGTPTRIAGTGTSETLVASTPQPTGAPLQSTPLPTPRQAGEIAIAVPPTPEPLPASEPRIALQYVSTDDTIAPIAQAIPIASTVSEENAYVSLLADNFYLVYTFLLAVVSIILASFIHPSRMNMLKAAVHTAIFLGALLVPTLGPTVRAMIF